MLIGLAFAGGLCVGSFLNICIYRIPRREGLAFPPSHCAHCAAALPPLEIVPVINYLWRKGRCRHCGCPVSRRYPVVEMLTGILFATCAARFGPDLSVIGPALMGSLLIVATFIDLEHLVIPDIVVLWGFSLGVAVNLITGEHSLTGMLLGAAIGFIVPALVVLGTGGMGWGDVKLGGAVGVYLGWPGIILALALAFLLGGIVSVWLLIGKKKTGKDMIAFAPFFATGTMIALLWGEQILSWYLALVMP